MTDPEMEARMRVASRIREARQLAGLSQAQVARVLGLHRPSVSEIEAGSRKVSALELGRLATTFDVSVAWLLGEPEGDPHADDPKLRLAARELSKLKPEELDRLLSLLSRMRRVHTEDVQTTSEEDSEPRRIRGEGVD